MADNARQWTDKELKALERKMASDYFEASRQMKAKLEKELESYAKAREEMLKALGPTKADKEAFDRWCESQAARHVQMSTMADRLAQAASNANQRAADALNDHLPHVYAENANRAAFAVDRAIRRDTNFALVDEDTVRNIMQMGSQDVLIREVVTGKVEEGMERVQSIRKANFRAMKDVRWNRQQFASAINQGILQGESVPNIARRVSGVFGKNKRVWLRAARTATTSAENAGRVSSYERAERLGIPLVEQWVATLDERTRESHREMDGEQIEVGGTFSNGLQFPADPAGDPEESWNCRCTLRAHIEGYEDSQGERWSRLPSGMTYEQWKAGKAIRRAESYKNETGRVSGAWMLDGSGFASDKAVEQAVEEAAKASIAEASRMEGTVTPILQETAENEGFEFAGFEYRLKGEGSLKRKIMTELKDYPSQTSVNECNRVAAGIHDNLRYTFLVEPSDFGASYARAVEQLGQSGCEMVRVKNTMANTTGSYKGVNTLVRTDGGYVFELQFHTADSYAAKDKAHAFYEIERVSEAGSKEWKDAHEAGAAIFKAVPLPNGAESISSFDIIGR